METDMIKWAEQFPFAKDPDCPASHAYLAAKAIEDFAYDLIDLLELHIKNHDAFTTTDSWELKGFKQAVAYIKQDLERIS